MAPDIVVWIQEYLIELSIYFLVLKITKVFFPETSANSASVWLFETYVCMQGCVVWQITVRDI